MIFVLVYYGVLKIVDLLTQYLKEQGCTIAVIKAETELFSEVTKCSPGISLSGKNCKPPQVEEELPRPPNCLLKALHFYLHLLLRCISSQCLHMEGDID